MPVHPPLLSQSELQKFEAPLIALANMSGGDLSKLFYAFFSFLNRRTDFYCILPDEPISASGGQRQIGFKEGQAEQILLASFRKFPLRKIGNKTGTSAGPSGAGAATPPATPAKLADDTLIEEKKTVQNSVDNSRDVDPSTSIVKGNITAPESAEETKESARRNATKSAIRYTDEGRQVPVGNGGSTTRYVWTQTLEEAVVHIPVPEGTCAKDLDVEINPSSISIRRKDAPSDNNLNLDPLSGTLFARVKPSESTWTMETNSSSDSNTTTILITLDKVQKTWWSTVISGDPEIDTTMVDSTRHIGTYDERTQAQIRRIMFDQRQERLGLPSSEELSGVKEGSHEGLPKGVEVIDQAVLDRAGASGRKTG
eukprot:scaffold18488_cov59-Cyclotella_meneghiniana.AAC.11